MAELPEDMEQELPGDNISEGDRARIEASREAWRERPLTSTEALVSAETVRDFQEEWINYLLADVLGEWIIDDRYEKPRIERMLRGLRKSPASEARVFRRKLRAVQAEQDYFKEQFDLTEEELRDFLKRQRRLELSIGRAESKNEELSPEWDWALEVWDAVVEITNADMDVRLFNFDVFKWAAALERKIGVPKASHFARLTNFPGVGESREKLREERKVGRVGRKIDQIMRWMMAIHLAQGPADHFQAKELFKENFGGETVEELLAPGNDKLSEEMKERIREVTFEKDGRIMPRFPDCFIDARDERSFRDVMDFLKEKSRTLNQEYEGEIPDEEDELALALARKICNIWDIPILFAIKNDEDKERMLEIPIPPICPDGGRVRVPEGKRQIDSAEICGKSDYKGERPVGPTYTIGQFAPLYLSFLEREGVQFAIREGDKFKKEKAPLLKLWLQGEIPLAALMWSLAPGYNQDYLSFSDLPFDIQSKAVKILGVKEEDLLGVVSGPGEWTMISQWIKRLFAGKVLEMVLKEDWLESELTVSFIKNLAKITELSTPNKGRDLYYVRCLILTGILLMGRHENLELGDGRTRISEKTMNLLLKWAVKKECITKRQRDKIEAIVKSSSARFDRADRGDDFEGMAKQIGGELRTVC